MSGFNARLGFTRGDAPHTIELDAGAEHEVVPGTIHFAVLTTLGEVAASSSVDAPVVPVAVHVQLLTRAKPGRLLARGTLLRRGGRLAFARGEVEQDGRTIAAVDVTFALV